MSAVGRPQYLAEKQLPPQNLPQNVQQQQNQPQHPSNLGVAHRDDGSSGYGSPDSETFETPATQ
jgi:hypothetical protein